MSLSPDGPVRLDFGPTGPWPVAITIPARNEADRIVPCLNAAAESLRGRGGIVVAVNASGDDTFALVHAWFRDTGARGILLDEPAPPPGSGVGRARDLAVKACRWRLAPRAAVMTTDADSRVSADWVDANLAELARADLICGTVLPDPEEFARLPACIGARCAIEGEYAALTLAVRRLFDPLPWDPDPTHLHPAGASLAFRADLYADVGGIPDLQTAEDRAFAAAAEARGWRVRHSSAARVVTTCRLDGRAPNGMAGCLSARIFSADPLVDEALEPAATTILRAKLRGDMRRRMGHASFAATWAQIEATRPDLRRTRLRLSDLGRELPVLAAAVDALMPQAEKQIA